MAQYTEEFLASARHGYENTSQPMAELARELGIGITTLSTMAAKQGWAKRSERKRGLPPAMQLLAEAQALAMGPHPSRLGAERLAPQDGGANTATPTPTLPLSGGGGASEQADLHAQLRHILTQLIANEQLAVAGGARSPQSVRNLATMIQALRALNGGTSGLTPAGTTIENEDDDDLPRDLDAFRDALAKRIDALFASTVDAAHARAHSERASAETTG